MTMQREKQNVTANDILTAITQAEDIHLSHCTITGPLDINRLLDTNENFDTTKLQLKNDENCTYINLPQELVFDNCLFEENVVFSGPWSDTDSISVTFEKDVLFNSSKFHAQARFRKSVFNATAGFDGCDFDGIATLKNAVIKGEAKFRTVRFGGYALMGSIVCHAYARFTNSHFVKGITLDNAVFNASVDFNGVYASSRSVPAFEHINFANAKAGQDVSFWRFVTQAAHDAGYYLLAGDCFYRERCANLRQKFRGTDYDSLNKKQKIARCLTGVRLIPEFIFGKLLFGYGEKPVNVLIASACTILLCAFLYAMPGALNHQNLQANPGFLEGLYFSTITFTTIGYGEIYPNPQTFIRYLAMTEGITGAILVALFVVCLAKRFSRG
jgi:hypothetical protein